MDYRFRLGVIALYCCCFFGCSHDDYHRPAVKVESHWGVKDDFAVRSNQKLPYLQWWLAFDDPVLKQLMEQGLHTNQQVLISKSRIEAAMGEVKKVKNQWIPSMDFWAGYANNPIYGFPGTIFAFVPSYFINFYQQYHQYKISRMHLGEVRADDDVVKLMLISEIAKSYFGYQAYNDYLKQLTVLRDDLAHMQSIAEKINQAGIIADIQPHLIENQLMRVEGEKHLTHRNMIRMRNALRYLLNKNPGPIKTTKEFSDLMKKPKVIHQVPMRVLLDRPDMKVAEYRLKAAFYNVKLARSPFLPRFEFDVFPGVKAGNNAYSFPQSYLQFNDQLLKVHIFKWSVLGEIDQAKGQKKAIFYEFLDTLRRALRDTSTAYENHDKATKNLLAIEKATHQLWLVYQRNLSLTEQGIQSEMELLNSKIEYDRMRLVLNKAQLQQLISIVRLYQELAGGYKANDEEPQDKTHQSLFFMIAKGLKENLQAHQLN